jgi:preprotein translocase subunit SecD
MRRSRLYTLLLILGLTLFGAYVAWPGARGVFGRQAQVVEGLDLQGGLQVLLRADLPPGQQPTAQNMEDARQIVEQRVNGLGVSEPVVQRQGGDRIVVELPGVKDPQQAIRTLQGTGLLEFVDQGQNPPFSDGQTIRTDFKPASQASNTPAGGTPAAQPTAAGTARVTPGATAAAAQTTPEPAGPVYHTVMTGAHIKSAEVGFDEQTQQRVVLFTLDDEGSRIFADYTSRNVGKPFAIVLDKKVVSAPTIQNAITGGRGQITGVQDQANSLAIQLRYGSLPVPLKIESSSTVGASLGKDSVDRSITAGVIGVLAVALFMILYYRLPGLVSVAALVIYGMLVFALFKLIPVVLTLAGIAGFVLSIGMAVDANVLIFARLKEELRRGRTLAQAVEAGFKNAWPSIRDSNVSTLITCAILAWFGSTFGASIIRGFALTLAIGVLVSMFTAIVVTRSLLRLVVSLPAVRNIWLWGVGQEEVVAPVARPGAGPALGGSRAR